MINDEWIDISALPALVAEYGGSASITEAEVKAVLARPMVESLTHILEQKPMKVPIS